MRGALQPGGKVVNEVELFKGWIDAQIVADWRRADEFDRYVHAADLLDDVSCDDTMV